MSNRKTQAGLPQVVCRRCYLSTIARPWRQKCLHCGAELPEPEETVEPDRAKPPLAGRKGRSVAERRSN